MSKISRRTGLTLAASAMLIVLGGCATTGSISYDSDPAQDFSGYSTFAWAADDPAFITGTRPISPLVTREIASAVRSTLEARGYNYVDDIENADFGVTFTVGARDGMEQYMAPEFHFSDYTAWGWGGDYFGLPVPTRRVYTTSRVNIREYTDGTLSVDIYDVERQTPVWHGAGEKRLTRAELAGENVDIPADVAQILSNFPPR